MREDRVLLVEDDAGLRNLLRDEMEGEGLQVFPMGSAEDAVAWLNTSPAPDLVVSDLRLPDASGLTLLPRLKSLDPVPEIMLITAFGSVRQAVEALKAGADEFLTKPLDIDHFMISIGRLLKSRHLRLKLDSYRSLLSASNFHGLVAESDAMMNLMSQIKRIASADGPVLLLGESGTGKELIARALHEESSRREGPYLTVNCGGIPGELMESEFFGHTSGAFTGARGSRPGLIQQADGGTLLLDELGELPLALQAKLLRVLQDGEVRSVGSDKAFHVDIRIVAATNLDLSAAVERGTFREDLYYRLETFTLEIPPLRERGEDIVLLANHFLAQLAARRNLDVRGFSDAALSRLRRYGFPGNVRELENAVERAATFCDGQLIEPAHLPERFRDARSNTIEEPSTAAFAGLAVGEPLLSLETLQRRYIDYVMAQTGGNKRRAAEILGITRRTLYRWLG